MGELASVIDEVLSQDSRELADAALGERLVELEQGMARLMGAFLDTLAKFDGRMAFAAEGVPSAAAWLARHCRMGRGDAAARVRAARRLRAQLPETREALRAGEISWAHARVVSEQVGETAARLLRRARDEQERALVERLVRDAEPLLVDAARALDPRDTARVARRWQHLVDQDGFLADAEADHASRRLDVSVLAGDRLCLDGDLYGADGQVVAAAIAALAAPRGPEGLRTPKQRRADALVELCRRALDTGTLPARGGEKPHVTVEVSLDTLERRLGSPPGELAQMGPISGETARRLACDAAITRVITGADSEPLDVGRKTRVVPPAIRRALVHRDRGCVWDGCDTPAEWTDAHHIHHWADGGPTSLSNLVLLCRRHHRELHEGRRQLPPARDVHTPPARAPDEEPW